PSWKSCHFCPSCSASHRLSTVDDRLTRAASSANTDGALWGASCPRQGSATPTHAGSSHSTSLLPACTQRTSGAQSEEGFHDQEAHAPEFPRDLQEGGEALAGRAS